MIGDVSRTGTYRKAILGNASIAFKDKVVLDLGAGQSHSIPLEILLIGYCRLGDTVLSISTSGCETCHRS